MNRLDDPLDSARPPASQRTLPALLKQRVARNGEAPLFSDRATTWSACEAIDAAARRAGVLGEQGVKKGDRVAILCSNRIEFIETMLGCAWIGAVAVPINTASRGMQLQHILSNSGARLLVAEASLLEAVFALPAQTTSLEAIWAIGAVPGIEPGVHAFSVREFPRPGEALEAVDLEDGDPFAILYTSGTSGLSKGVVCPHAQFYWWGANTGGDLEVRKGDVLYTCLPLFHTNALNSFCQALMHDAQLIVDRRFSASGFFDALIETGATVTFVLGAMVPILLSRPESQKERAHRVRVALAPGVPAKFQNTFTARTGIGLIDGYGSTETNSVIGGKLAERRDGFMGKLAAGFHARVVDAHDRPVPDGEAGELILRADEPWAFASGYFGMPEKTVEAWRNLWFHTGDRVVRDASGYYRFMDRLKDVIRRRGENISSFEVEQVLLSHPAIELAAVFAVKSALAEDEVMAAIVLREGAVLDALELVKFCEPRLPYFAVPRYLDFRTTLPKTENGKIQKFRLRDIGITSTTWDLEASGYRLRRA
ncbi:crotonobetaine/carnitine-CoA ligase [Paraburkholderia bannensis]|uniref:Crotonobetaine/carnitine-CoA ligase n=1 Tax=Paraburkholderia bannensis TaxID=765414 RepID=A0A7W9WQS9_9BURK|nr:MULTISPECIES: ATP-dependent acyl-CoA ligase [Paraburkholderia]MBB3257184.1 crotonobetaine/carnitine-CoA ligase [Paraburkholderia sp. WP4_3_2]MBB6102420.1 crotonobetaine/carnitine-CoA ligase [Paraburkholderia bannensis]